MERRQLIGGLAVFVAMFAVAAAFFYVPFHGGMTGLFAFPSQETRLSVLESQNAEVTRFEFDQFITIGESVNVSVEMTNTGSVSAPSDFDLEVYDVNNTLLYTYPAPDRTLAPGELRNRVIRHTPHETGTYIIRLDAEIGGEIFRTAKFLSVSEEPEPPEPEPITITRTRVETEFADAPEPPEPSEPPTPRWNVEAPQQATVGEGRSTVIPIRIANTGEAVLTNIRLAVTNSNNLTVEANPKIIFRLLPEETKSFVLDVAAANRTLTDQTVGYRVSSSTGLGGSGEITVDVVPFLTMRQLSQQIEDLESVIVEAAAELRTARQEGLDVEQAAARLDEARQSLDAARDSIGEQEIQDTRENLDATRQSLDRFYSRLFQARGESLEVRADLIRPAYVVIAVAVLAAALLIGVYYYLREKQTQRPKLLREQG